MLRTLPTVCYSSQMVQTPTLPPGCIVSSPCCIGGSRDCAGRPGAAHDHAAHGSTGVSNAQKRHRAARRPAAAHPSPHPLPTRWAPQTQFCWLLCLHALVGELLAHVLCTLHTYHSRFVGHFRLRYSFSGVVGLPAGLLTPSAQGLQSTHRVPNRKQRTSTRIPATAAVQDKQGVCLSKGTTCLYSLAVPLKGQQYSLLHGRDAAAADLSQIMHCFNT